MPIPDTHDPLLPRRVRQRGLIVLLANQNTVIANLAQPQARGSYFGVSAIAIAFGGGLGNYMGGLLYDTAIARGAPALPWLVIAAVGIGAAWGLWLLDRHIRRVHAGNARAGARSASQGHRT